MKKLQKLKLNNKAKIMTAPQMKSITGGYNFNSDGCYTGVDVPKGSIFSGTLYHCTCANTGNTWIQCYYMDMDMKADFAYYCGEANWRHGQCEPIWR